MRSHRRRDGPDAQVYAEGEMDLAGFVVGVVERERLLEPSRVREGDRLLGIPSNGLHTNGFSLVRKVFSTDDDPAALFRRFDGLSHQLGEDCYCTIARITPCWRRCLACSTAWRT